MRSLLWLKTLLIGVIIHLSVPVATSSLGGGLSSSCQTTNGGVTDCSNRGLVYVPRDLPPSTKVLRLQGNSLERIEAADFPIVLAELEELDLSGNNITRIDTSTFCHKLPNLKILRLTRNKLTSLPDLRVCSSLVELHSSSNDMVTVNGAMISGLPRLEKLDLSKNNITTVVSSMFPTNTSVKQLLLNNNKITSMSYGAFANIPTLERLRVSRNKLTGLPKGLFTGLLNLQSLDFSKNRLTVIGHFYFTELRKVRSINLERNLLERLLDGSFYDCGALESLKLDSNRLSSVEGGHFFGLVNLQQLSLANNNISTIKENTWLQASSIQELDLSHNHLQLIRSTHFTRAGNIRTLKLANNKIKTIEENAFNELSNLNALDLSGNELSDSIQSPSTTVFHTLTKLTSLNLRGNDLQRITSKLLRGLESLQDLQLTNNPVTTVESYAFSTLPNLNALGLSTEKMVCDCKISWLPRWLNLKRLSDTVQAKCALPRPLRGRSIFEIDSDQLVCDPGEMPVIPFITREIQPTNALKGSNVTLTCIATASSKSPVTIEWRKDSKIIPESSGQIETDASTADDRVALLTTYLRLTNVDQDAEGSYQCGFKNEFGQDYSESTLLQVLVFPSFTNVPANVSVKTGQDAKLLCEATGYPQPFLSWSKDRGRNFIAAREGRFQVNPDNLNEFIIKDVEWKDRGVYYCNATNMAGSIISNATISVLVPPMFTEPISCTNTRAGAYLLKCQVDGNPKTPIVWYKDGHVIQASEKYIFSVTYNNLFIIDGTTEDSGMYMCSARNLLGQVTDQCEIIIKDSETQVATVPILEEEKSTVLDQNTITGLIVIAVVCCVVGTSLIWVVIIYQTRRRQNRNGGNELEETAVPLNSNGIQTGSGSTHKIGDSISNSSGSSQTKTDSFLEYRGSRDSPGVFSKGRDKFPTMDSELAAAMEPLNPNQDSVGSLTPDSHAYPPYSHHTVGGGSRGGGHCNRIPMSTSDYYTSERAHPFSTFQPSRHHRVDSTNTHQQRNKPSHSISAEYIPYIDKRLPPPDLAHVLHQLRAPNQPPQAVVSPVHSHCKAMASSVSQLSYEEPGYMNLPRSAVTPSLPKNCGHSEEHSDYMNVEPKDTHIYQNTSKLSINRHPDSDANRTLVNTPPGIVMTSQSNNDLKLLTNKSISSPAPSHILNESISADPDRHIATTTTSITESVDSDPVNPGPSVNASTGNPSCKFDHNGHVHYSSADRRRREGLADSSFVEKKYGLIFTNDSSGDAYHDSSGDAHHDASRTSDKVNERLQTGS